MIVQLSASGVVKAYIVCLEGKKAATVDSEADSV